MIGTKLSHFEITAKLGEGGMGEVYQATDTRLDRTVAVKVLAGHLAEDLQSRERFEREAKAVSSLNHPHICTLHDVGEQDGQLFLVMEMVEGESLASRLEKGRLPLEQALEFAVQIADALDKAHRRGVVHRDLKPGNIMITKSGAKLLDFGLARLGVGSPIQTSAEPDSYDPTEPLTAQGTIVGTLRYMAPEQLEGKTVDSRADIFAFGAVLYEMLTGRKAFEGSSQASVIASIMGSESRVMVETADIEPPMLARVTATCLARDPDDRWQSAGDLERELRWIAGGDVMPVAEAEPVRGRGGVLPWGIAVAALAIAAIALIGRTSSDPAPAPKQSVRLAIALPEEAPLAPAGSFFLGVGRPSLALSQDGSLLAYVALADGERRLYLRDMLTGEILPLAGTGDAQGPFFSPDGDWLGFFAENKLKRIDIDGGEPEEIANAVWGYGADWYDDFIYFSPTEAHPIQRIDPSGGPIETITSAPAAWPSVLPGGSELLVTVPATVRPSVALAKIAPGSSFEPLRSGNDARFVPPGYLVYAGSGNMLAAPFDLDRGAVTGDSTVVLDDVRTETHGSMQATWSDDGTLIYAPGSDLGQGEFVWLDRDGGREALGLPPGSYDKFELSPDGSFLAVPIRDGATRDIWIYEIGRDVPQRLTLSGAESFPVWDRDGTSIYYQSQRTQGTGIYKLAVGGANQEPIEVVAPAPEVGRPYRDTPEGLFFDRGSDVYLSVRSEEGPPKENQSGENQSSSGPVIEPVLGGEFQEAFPALSPDGSWLAYMSDETGQWQIYVVSYPDQQIKRLVSTTGGEEPRWSPDGSEIIYRYGSQWFTVSFLDDPELELGLPELLFEGPYINIPGYSWDISREGDRFLLVENPGQNEPLTELVVITNFFDEIERSVLADQ